MVARGERFCKSVTCTKNRNIHALYLIFCKGWSKIKYSCFGGKRKKTEVFNIAQNSSGECRIRDRKRSSLENKVNKLRTVLGGIFIKFSRFWEHIVGNEVNYFRLLLLNILQNQTFHPRVCFGTLQVFFSINLTNYLSVTQFFSTRILKFGQNHRELSHNI